MSEALAVPGIDDFVAAIGDVRRLPDVERFIVDGLAPKLAVAPATLAQLQTILTAAHRHGLTVIPLGGGTHGGLGNLPSAYDVAVSLAAVDRVVAHEPADMTVTVEPGVRLCDLQAQLAVHGQFLPLDPPGADAATVGGVLAANASGPLRHAYGTARDWLIGMRVVRADGSTSKSGGRVVKNVTGYDMHKLHVGALGSLGVIAETTFKLAPLPAVQTTLIVGCDSAADGASAILRARDRGLSVQSAELLSPAVARAVADRDAWCVLVRLAAGEGAVARSVRELAAIAGETSITECDDGAAAWERWSRAFRPAVLSLRVSVPPSRAGAMAAAIEREGGDLDMYISATVAAGVMRVSIDALADERAPALIGRARTIADREGGSVVVESASPAVKRVIDVFGEPRSDFAIMRRLKREFDPDGTLAPGRFVGRL